VNPQGASEALACLPALSCARCSLLAARWLAHVLLLTCSCSCACSKCPSARWSKRWPTRRRPCGHPSLTPLGGSSSFTPPWAVFRYTRPRSCLEGLRPAGDQCFRVAPRVTPLPALPGFGSAIVRKACVSLSVSLSVWLRSLCRPSGQLFVVIHVCHLLSMCVTFCVGLCLRPCALVCARVTGSPAPQRALLERAWYQRPLAAHRVASSA
jgi:hypothetical protein